MKQTLLSTILLASALSLVTLFGSQQGATASREAVARQVVAACQDPIAFRHTLDNEPIELDFRPQQKITSAVEEFHCTGDNPYSGDPAAVDAGQKIYRKYCVACHLPDGTGRIGPSLADESWKYPRTGSDVGKFEIIYAGGAGAMQAFGLRIDQDEILKVMAFLETLGPK